MTDTRARIAVLGNRRRAALAQAALMVALSVIAAGVIFPFYYMIVSSVRPPFYRFDAVQVDLLPSGIDLSGYARVLAAGGMDLLNGLKNTLILELAIVVGSTVLNTLAAYAFAKRNFPGRDALFALFLLTVILPGEVTLVPKYLLFRDMGLLNTFWALILPALTGVFGIFLLRQFISQIPDAYLDAARIDGANELQVIASVVFPMAAPAIATYALLTFLGVWNDLTGPLIFMNKQAVWTLQVAIFVFSSTYSFMGGIAGDPEGIRMQTLFAGLLVSALPTVLVFVIFQRRLIAGITLAGLKG
jgi:multiple sugar transport system permease protein